MIARSLYSLLVRLHPREFREAYGEEMLWVFDQDSMERTPYWLLWDGARSLVRQRLFRPGGSTTPAVAVNGPSFLVLEETRVRPIQLLRGVAAAAVLFGLVLGPAVDTGHMSGTLRIPTIYTYQKSGPGAYQIEERRMREAKAHDPGAAAAERTLPLRSDATEQAVEARDARETGGSPTVYRVPGGREQRYAINARLLALLDLDGDGWIDREERAAEGARRWERLFLMVPTDEQGRVAVEDLTLLLRVEIAQ